MQGVRVFAFGGALPAETTDSHAIKDAIHGAAGERHHLAVIAESRCATAVVGAPERGIDGARAVPGQPALIKGVIGIGPIGRGQGHLHV